MSDLDFRALINKFLTCPKKNNDLMSGKTLPLNMNDEFINQKKK